MLCMHSTALSLRRLYTVIECKVPRRLLSFLERIVDAKHRVTPLQLPLVDPFGLRSNSTRNISFIALPVSPTILSTAATHCTRPRSETTAKKLQRYTSWACAW